MRSWVKHNNLEDMTDLLMCDLNDFTPTGTLCYYKESAEAKETIMMPNTPLKELYNLYRYIQHLILESKFNMMMMNLTTLLMRTIGYCKPEENT